MPPVTPARCALPYRAVMFDFFNTLTVAVHRGPQHAHIARLLGCRPADWRTALDRTFRARASGRYGRGIDGLRRLAAEAGGRPSRQQLRAALGARINAVRADAPLRPSAVPVLRALRRRGLRIAVVSDCWYELPVVLPTLPIAGLVDASVFSVEIGRTKPDPELYLTACDRLGVAPHECLYLGDGGGHELSGAGESGMTAVRLAEPDLGDHLTFDADVGWTGPAVGALTDVVTTVDGILAPAA
jgi:putative hydrolase of the HAD superfamily